MKADEYLSRASRELRDEGEAPPSEVAATRARIMTTMRRDARRPRRVAFWVMPIAAVLAASTALATNRVEIQKVWHRLLGNAPTLTQPLSIETSRAAPLARRDVLPPAEPEAPPAPSPIAEDPAPPTIAGVAPGPTTPAVPTTVAAATQAPSPKPAALSTARGARTPTPAAATAPEPQPETPSVNTPSAEPSAESEALPLELYKKAHRLHFQQQKYGDAIVAWDDYLRAQPNGSLAVEARYNRAIALLRSGRRDEARAALAPFARGEIAGGYRAEEAQSLLHAIEGIVH